MSKAQETIEKLEKRIIVVKDSLDGVNNKTDKEKDQILEEIINRSYQETISLATKNNIPIKRISETFGKSWNKVKKDVVHWDKFGNFNRPHGNRGKVPHNAKPKELKIKVLIEVSKMIEHNEEFIGISIPYNRSILFTFMKIQHPELMSDISKSTFNRWINQEIVGEVDWLQYDHKSRRRLKNRLKKMIEMLKSQKKNISEFANDQEISYKTINRTPSQLEEVEVIQYEPSKRREEYKPGECIQWDGSMDIIHNKQKVTRMQAIDRATLSTEGMYFVKNENNLGFQKLLLQILENGIPEVIEGDKRKGVDPKQEGALHAILCGLIGIRLDLSSNSIHKAELESMNGKMHPLVSFYSSINNIKTIEGLNDNIVELKELTNNHFGYEKPDYSHLRQATPDQMDMLRGEIKQIFITSQDGIIFNKVCYGAINKDGNRIILPRQTWAIIKLVRNKPTRLWIQEGIFDLTEIELASDLEMDMVVSGRSDIKQLFIDNRIIILNEETLQFLIKTIKSEALKEVIRDKLWMVDQQIQKAIARNRQLAKDADKYK